MHPAKTVHVEYVVRLMENNAFRKQNEAGGVYEGVQRKDTVSLYSLLTNPASCQPRCDECIAPAEDQQVAS